MSDKDGKRYAKLDEVPRILHLNEETRCQSAADQAGNYSGTEDGNGVPVEPRMVSMNGLHGDTLYVEHIRRPPNYLVLAVCVLCFINPPFGMAALAFSLLSNSHYKRGNLEPARQYGRSSMWISVVGIITTILVMCVVIVVLFTVDSKKEHHSTFYYLNEGQ